MISPMQPQIVIPINPLEPIIEPEPVFIEPGEPLVNPEGEEQWLETSPDGQVRTTTVEEKQRLILTHQIMIDQLNHDLSRMIQLVSQIEPTPLQPIGPG